jgi:hypothetical protein
MPSDGLLLVMACILAKFPIPVNTNCGMRVLCRFSRLLHEKQAFSGSYLPLIAPVIRWLWRQTRRMLPLIAPNLQGSPPWSTFQADSSNMSEIARSCDREL